MCAGMQTIHCGAGPDGLLPRTGAGTEFTFLCLIEIERVARALQLSGPLRQRCEANSWRRRSTAEPGSVEGAAFASRGFLGASQITLRITGIARNRTNQLLNG